MTTGPEVMRDALFSLTGLSLGASLFAAVVHATMLKYNAKRHAFYIMSKLGYFLVAGTILKSILIHVNEVPITADALVYGAGLALASVGFIGVALDAHAFYATTREIEANERTGR